MDSKAITISGAGLVGSLLGTMLAQRGHRVHIYERRPDMRSATLRAGRSINLAMSDRGLYALEVAGVADAIQAIAIPMYGRMIHDEHGGLRHQPYGVGSQAINSVSRGELNKILMTVAEQHGVEFTFNWRCVGMDTDATSAVFEDETTGLQHTVESDILFGADGAFSAIRSRMQMREHFDYSQAYQKHSYKELHIPPTADGGFHMEKHALHIWPRKSFMLIALPNLDGSFTCTLFLSHDGEPSFSKLRTEADVLAFFQQYFPDVVPLMPTLIEDFFTNPESALVTIKCEPWVVHNVALIGDAAHALVPFYGQGMNCGFEDCRILMDCLDVANNDWTQAFDVYQHFRKPDGDAIADLAVVNFEEMRDKVADEQFLRRKQLEAYLHNKYPDRFVPLYTLVTFSREVPYSEALRVGRENDALIDQLLSHSTLVADWTTEESQGVIHEIMAKRKPLAFKPISPRSSKQA